ncbi:MAG: caspase family protein [Ignavibacteria bacterium]|nr:caspase family protein [Ignavibacteria bacterium]
MSQKIIYFFIILNVINIVYAQEELITNTSKPKNVKIVADTKYPTIKILSPQNFRGMKPLKESSLEIIGLASDESGVSLVSVNGKAAQLSEPSYSEVQQYNVSGKVVKFSGEVSLSMRENTITIIATDTKNNTAEETFTVVREEEKISTLITTNDSQFIKGKYYALIIAVQDYKSIMGLEYPLQDAENVKNVLTTNYTFENNAIHFLKNPNRKDIFSALQQLKKKLSAEDNLLIYYAGHGFWDVDNSQGYWLPASASWDDRAEWISNSDIRDNIKSIKTKHTLLISDACFSGGIFKSREAKEKPDISIQKMYELPSRKAITSGTFKTAVPDKSVFADYLLKRLKENSAKYLDAENLYLNFKQAVINNGPAVPQFGVIYDAGDEGGDFIFVRK